MATWLATICIVTVTLFGCHTTAYGMDCIGNDSVVDDRFSCPLPLVGNLNGNQEASYCCWTKDDVVLYCCDLRQYAEYIFALFLPFLMSGLAVSCVVVAAVCCFCRQRYKKRTQIGLLDGL